MRTIQERLNSKTYVQDGHLLWGGAADEQGYGFLSVKNKVHRVTRVVWEIVYGPIPEGLYVLHICNTRSCVRPVHLYLGTQSDNMQDRVRDGNDSQANQTHCINGHEFTADNTYHIRQATRGGSIMRQCKTCTSKRQQRRKMKI